MKDVTSDIHCDVCGALATLEAQKKICRFCKFEKNIKKMTDDANENLIFARDINQYFKRKYAELNHGDTFKLNIPITRFYKKPIPQNGQVNFFRSKNIMFLLEQHGFQMVRRKSRFSCELSLVVRKV